MWIERSFIWIKMLQKKKPCVIRPISDTIYIQAYPHTGQFSIDLNNLKVCWRPSKMCAMQVSFSLLCWTQWSLFMTIRTTALRSSRHKFFYSTTLHPSVLQTPHRSVGNCGQEHQVYHGWLRSGKKIQSKYLQIHLSEKFTQYPFWHHNRLYGRQLTDRDVPALPRAYAVFPLWSKANELITYHF